jgi:Arc/MetJ family transcription regulator
MPAGVAGMDASDNAISDWQEFHLMRATISIDDELFDRAQKLTGVTGKSAVVNTALQALIEREAAHRLARMGGTEPDAEAPPRRRF